jgi:hypothetical protein
MGEDDMDAISFALERFRTASMASVSAIDPHGTELRDVAAADLRNLVSSGAAVIRSKLTHPQGCGIRPALSPSSTDSGRRGRIRLGQ